MIDRSEFRWLRRHTVVAPFGIFAVTLALAWWERVLPWPSVGPGGAAELVDLAAIIYGMLAVLFERGVRLMFWALDQRRQWRDRWRKEAQAAGLGGQLTWESIRLGERSTLLPVPIWPVLAAIPLAFFLVGLRHAIYAAWPGLRPPDPLKVNP